MKRTLTIFLFLFALNSMAQNRVFDTISFLRGGQLYQILLYTDSMKVNGKWYMSFPGFGTTSTKAARGNHAHSNYEPTITAGTTGQFYGWDKTWRTPTVQSYEIQTANDIENNWTVPFTLKSTSVIIYNGVPLRSTQWSGAGVAILNVSLDTRKYDHLLIIN